MKKHLLVLLLLTAIHPVAHAEDWQSEMRERRMLDELSEINQNLKQNSDFLKRQEELKALEGLHVSESSQSREKEEQEFLALSGKISEMLFNTQTQRELDGMHSAIDGFLSDVAARKLISSKQLSRLNAYTQSTAELILKERVKP